MPDYLVAAAEIADMLGISRQRVHQLHKAGSMPAPYDTLKLGPVWLKVDIEAWAREAGRIH